MQNAEFVYSIHYLFIFSFQGETACNILVIQFKSQLWPGTQESDKKDIEFGNLDGQVPKLSEREKKARKLCKEFLIENCPSCSATKRELVPKKDSDDAGQTMTGLEIEDEVKESKVRLELKICSIKCYSLFK